MLLLIAFGLVIVIALQLRQIRKEAHMSKELDRLTASVAAETSRTESLVTLVQGLAQMIRDSATDPAALSKLADALDAETANIQAAIDANTPGAPAAPPATPPIT